MHLKDYVCNRAHPEALIIEGYIAEEYFIFCLRYLEGVETTFNQSQRNYETIRNVEKYKFLYGKRVSGRIV